MLAVGGLAPHFQLELTREGRMDAMAVLVEPLGAAEGLAEALERRVREVVGVSVTARLLEPGGVARSQGKAVRIVDRRPGG